MIPLCASCHRNFDHHLDPGFSFIPTDIQYFIEFELEDRKRREVAEQEGKEGKELQRCVRVPSATLYKQHQFEKGEVGPDANGGLYRPVFLMHCLLQGFFLFDEIQSCLSKARPWHGAPLASLRRSILLLGNGRLTMLEKQEQFFPWRGLLGYVCPKLSSNNQNWLKWKTKTIWRELERGASGQEKAGRAETWRWWWLSRYHILPTYATLSTCCLDPGSKCLYRRCCEALCSYPFQRNTIRCKPVRYLNLVSL